MDCGISQLAARQDSERSPLRSSSCFNANTFSQVDSIAPSAVLHVCNIDPATGTDDLAAAVFAVGALEHDFEPADRPHGSVRFETVSAAAAALGVLHGMPVGPSKLRAAYAKIKLQPRPPHAEDGAAGATGTQGGGGGAAEESWLDIDGTAAVAEGRWKEVTP